jgi:hypothetical protein
MATNFYFQSGNTSGTTSEQRLVEDIIIESLQIYGHDTFYLPRTSVRRDQLFGEDILSRFTQSYPIEMYLSDVTGWSGQGELMTKFGLSLQNEVTFIVSKRRWEEAVSMKTDDLQLPTRPAEGDLVFLPKTNAFFEITYVDHLTPFYQLNKFFVYTLSCSLFRYSSQEINTGRGQIDDRVVGSFDQLKNAITDQEGDLMESMSGSPLEEADAIRKKLFPTDDRGHIQTEKDELLDFTIENPFGKF